MARPIIYHSNLLLSGSISGTAATTDNPVRKLRDGSINLPYEVTADVAGIQSGSVTLELTAAQAPDAFILPKCDLLSGHTIVLESMDDLAETNLATVVSADIVTPTVFLLSGTSGTTARAVWRMTITGAIGLAEQAKVHEWTLPTRYDFPNSPQIGVGRARVRQFTRLAIPGGQPFVRRDGLRLRRTAYQFVLVSGSEVDGLRAVVDVLEGGDAFTHTDDLAQSYWGELLEQVVDEGDEAGVSSVQLTVQEIRVES